jgi:hypothetical protein
VLWVLLAAVPAVFIVLATALAPGSLVRLTLEENGRQVTKVVNLAFGAGIHPAFMAPMAIVSLAALVGMFMMLDSRAADRRLVLAGQRRGALLAGRLALIALAALLATGVSLAVAATVADIQQWGSHVAASALLALTYALIGVILAPAVRPDHRSPDRVPRSVPRPRHRPGSDAPRQPARLGALPARLRRLPDAQRRRPYPRRRTGRPAAGRPGLAGRRRRGRCPAVRPQHANGPEPGRSAQPDTQARDRWVGLAPS